MAPLWISVVALVVATGGLLYAWRVLVVLSTRIGLLEARYGAGTDPVWTRNVDHRLMLMQELITEGLLNAKRREERSRGVVRGALKRLDEAGVEDPSVGAEAEELGVGDGEDGIPALMPPVYDPVESSPVLYEDSPIPGLSMAEYKELLSEGTG